MIVLIALATGVMTLVGGAFALKFKDKLHLILGFSAGAVIGVAFFDLIPEALELGRVHYDISLISSVVALAFLVYLIIDRFVLLHAHTEEEGHGHKGILGAGSLAFHSFLDGVAIGFLVYLIIDRTLIPHHHDHVEKT